MKVWRLGADRAEEWRSIRLTALRDVPEAFGARLADWQDRPWGDFAAWLNDVATFASGSIKGQPLASAGWLAGLHDADASRGRLVGVYARPEARGLGYAEAAIRAALADATTKGVTSIGLKVRAAAPHAQALYLRLGFCPTDRSDGTSDRGEPEIEMLKELAP